MEDGTQLFNTFLVALAIPVGSLFAVSILLDFLEGQLMWRRNRD